MLNHPLELTKYRFTLEAIDTISLPAYKGSTFHGGFGHALLKISPTWYQYFFEPSKNKTGDWPKPFILLPPLDEQEQYPKGHQFSCELTLIGEANQHYAIAHAAIEYLGLQMGLGHEQGKYRIVDIQQSQPTFNNIFDKIFDTTEETQKITLQLPTRLRLKVNNKLCRTAPTFQTLITRLTGRIKTLEKAYLDTEMDSDKQNYLIHKAKDIDLVSQHTLWDDWNRFSGRQKQWMKFGGLKGEISYKGDFKPLITTLQLGEWLHIGNKTSFGLGKYKITTPL